MTLRKRFTFFRLWQAYGSNQIFSLKTLRVSQTLRVFKTGIFHTCGSHTLMKKIHVLIVLFLFASVPTVRAATVFIRMPDGNPGRRVTAEIGFENAENMKAFRVTLDVSKGGILRTDPGEFSRNADFFPALVLRGQELNFVRHGENNTLHIIGLMPKLSSPYAGTGKIIFDIAESAVPGNTQELTLSGQIYTDTGNILEITQHSATFTVIPFADTDGDSLDDTWEKYYFGSLTQTGTEDYDFDTDSNLDEYRNGTDPTDNIHKGDTNRDGEISLKDVIAALQVCAGMNPEVCKASDVNRDGIISMEEAIWLLRMLAGTDD